MKLEEIFPTNGFSEQETELLIYSRDASSFEGKCSAIVWPTKKEQILTLLQYARRTGKRVTIRGAATSNKGGCIPTDSIVMDLSKMNKILRIEKDHVIVECGVILDELNYALGRTKQFPIKPIEHEVCTIGGMIATNTLGIHSYFKNMDQWVIALKIIDGSGKDLKIEGEDLNDFLGKEGVTGIIYQAKLKIITSYSPKTVSIFSFNTIQTLMNKIEELQKNENVLSIEYYDEFTSRMLDFGYSAHLLVEFEDNSGMIKDKEEIQKLDSLKEKLQHTLVKKRLTRKEDIQIPKENIPKLLHWLRKHQIPCYGHIKQELFFPCFKEDSKVPKEMYTIISTLKGKIAVSDPIGISRKELLSEDRKNNLKKLKNKYDSQRILNRGVLID
jgi:FAD/FMN-containing dehydrogenase